MDMQTPEHEKQYRIIHALLDCVLAVGVIIILSLVAGMLSAFTKTGLAMRIETAGVINILAFGTVLLLRRKSWLPWLGKWFSVPENPGGTLLSIVLTAAGFGIVLSQIDNMLRPVIGDSALYEILDRILDQPALSVFIFVGIVAPFSEEIFFRGYIFMRLRGSISKPTAIIAASLMFGIFHLNPSQMIAGFLTGLVLCYLTESSGGIFYSVIFHAVFNSLPFLFIMLNVSIDGYTEAGPGLYQPFWFTAVGFLLTTAGVFSLSHSLKFRRDEADLETGDPGDG